MICVSHPTGNTFVRALLGGLNSANNLAVFHTGIATGVGISGWLLDRFAGEEAERRRFDLPREKIVIHPGRESIRLLASRLGLSRLTDHESGWACVDSVYHSVDRALSRAIRTSNVKYNAVYAYEDGALETFRSAKFQRLRCLYDLPIPYWRFAQTIHKEEAALKPEWAVTLSGLRDSCAKLARKDEELALADEVFCASSFTRDSLQQHPGGLNIPVHVIPYGAPETPGERNQELPNKNENTNIALEGTEKKLKLLFVGGLSQRKGLSYLFEAVEKLGNAVELTVIGQRPPVKCPALDRELTKHRYIESLPHADILREMSLTDLFVFPSLLEGFGLVLLEAMSQGVPCITTTHTGAPDFLTDRVDGRIVPVRDVDAIVETVLELRENPDILSAMKVAARRTAIRQTWRRYQEEMVFRLSKTLK